MTTSELSILRGLNMSKRVKKVAEPIAPYSPVGSTPLALPSAGTHRRSRHLHSEMLKYDYPKARAASDIFNSLSLATRQKIESDENVEKETLVEGLRLTPGERKVIDCFCKLLDLTSQTKEGSDNYYLGNAAAKGREVDYYKGESTPAPTLGLSPYEIAKEYKGGEAVSGKDVANVLEIIQGLAEKKFLIKYTEKSWTGSKGNSASKERKVEVWSPIIWLPEITETERDSQGNVISTKKELLVVLSPIFRAQISSHFIVVPNDITRRTQLAYGNSNVSGATLKLRDYFLQELASSRAEVTISQEKLLWRLADDMMKESRKSLVKKQTLKAIETMVAMGLLRSWELKPSQISGEMIYYFSLDQDFNKMASSS